MTGNLFNYRSESELKNRLRPSTEDPERHHQGFSTLVTCSLSGAVMLIRLGPECKTRELIQVDAVGKLMDDKQNYLLRDGDELVFPGPNINPASRPG